MDGWMSGWVGGWMDGGEWVDGWVSGSVGTHARRRSGEWIGGWMDGLEGGMDRWMNGLMHEERVDQRMAESLPFAMAYRMAMLLVFRPLPTLRMGLFLVIISHTTMAKLKTSQRSV